MIMAFYTYTYTDQRLSNQEVLDEVSPPRRSYVVPRLTHSVGSYKYKHFLQELMIQEKHIHTPHVFSFPSF